MKTSKIKSLKKIFIFLLVIVIFIVFSLSFLTIGFKGYHDIKIWSPTYKKIDLTEILNKQTLTDEDYKIIYNQTGITKIGIQRILDSYNKDLIYDIQKDFFSTYPYYHQNFAPFLCAEILSYNSPKTVPLEDGDILISPSTHFSIFEFGHSAIVINGKTKEIINALNYSTPTDVDHASFIIDRPNFMILRVKTDEETRKKVALFASENLIGIDYSIFAGAIYPKFSKNIKKTQCAHLIWYAYYKFGINLDSNNGMIVMPKDIYKSKNVEVVQVYGLNPNNIW